MDTFGKRLRHIVTTLYANTEQFAEAAEVSTQQVYGYFNDRYYPKAKIIELLFSKGINLNWLFMGEGEMMIEDMTASEPAPIYLVAGEIEPLKTQHMIEQQVSRIQRLLQSKDLDDGTKLHFIESSLNKLNLLETKP